MPAVRRLHWPTSIRGQAILLFCILMFCYAYIHQRPGWNQNSRLDLLHALWVHKTFKIDAYHENTGDKSIHEGHYYSDKAPGIVFLGLPAFAASAGLVHLLDIPLDSPKGWFISDWMTTAGSVGVITALGGAAMFLFLCGLVKQRYAFLTTYIVFLGAAPFPYATMLFSHAAVIGLICIALWAIADPFFWSRMRGERTPSHSLAPIGGEGRDEGPPRWLHRHALAGLCCGLAISSEYTAATVAGGILALALLTNFKRGLVLALAAVPPLLLIPLYNWACFGGPLAFGYHHLALTEFQEMNKGIFGITFPPKASAAYLILISPERGLFFWTPFFVMSLLGLKRLSRASKTLFLISCLTSLVHIACIAGYYMPGGGAAVGPRHLAPFVPILCISAVLALVPYPRFGAYLGYCSLLMTGGATIISALPPEDVPIPILQYYIPKLTRFDFVPNLLSILSFPPIFTCIVLLAAISLPIASYVALKKPAVGGQLEALLS